MEVLSRRARAMKRDARAAALGAWVRTHGTFGPIHLRADRAGWTAMSVDRNGLQVLSRDECLDLLSQATLGRVAVSIAALPVVLPVHYGVFDGDVVFRTVEGTKLTGAVTNAVVAFEVDDIDDGGVGWSVLVVGRAEIVDDPVERAAAEEAIPPSWLPVAADHVVRVRGDVVSGRRIVRVAAGAGV
jgi:nitroimidazol reductase NimA-like FMN-containing flavoprotein (pyridoxamine 5'-phosphate oxidase superfamily)